MKSIEMAVRARWAAVGVMGHRDCGRLGVGGGVMSPTHIASQKLPRYAEYGKKF